MGGSSSSAGGGGVEAPNSNISDSLLKVLEVLCEGPISGFAYQGGQFGGDPLTATFYDDVVFRNLDGSYNFNVSGQGFQFAATNGYPNQLAISGFEHVSVNVPLPPDTRLSNPPLNAGLPKNLLVTFNTQQYPDANSVTINFKVPALYVVDTANGNTNGFEVDVQVDCSLNGSPFNPLSDGPLQFVGKNTTPYFRTYQYTLPITTPAQSFYQWTLRFTKTSQDVQSTSVADDIYVDSIAVVSASQYNYPNTALVGTFIDALQFGTVPSRSYLIQGLLVSVPSGYTPTQYTPGLTITQQCIVGIPPGNQNVGFVTQAASVLNGLYTGISVTGAGIPPSSIVDTIYSPAFGDANYGFHFSQSSGSELGPTLTYTGALTFSNPTYPVQTATAAIYPDVWNGTFTTGVWTDNPAWIFYDFVTNPRYGLGQYINAANIDIWTLYQLSQYCDEMVDNGLGLGALEPQFTINAFIKDAEDAYSMLLNLASAFRGMLYYANGTIRANTTDNKTPVFNYTNANVINSQFSYSSTARAARHNAVQIKYTDPSNLYRDNYVKLEDPVGITQYGYNEKQISAFGCTSLGQATRLGNWILTTERLRTETVSFQVGLDGLYLRPGDVFNLYDNFRMNRSQGGRVIAFDSTQQFITLDRPVNLDSGCIYALSCLVPQFNYDNISGITGSNQIPEIRNPQIQSCEVLQADLSGLSTLQVSGGFSGLSKNAVWILSATGVYTSGYIPTVFEQAPLYECLAIGQSSPGIFDVLALNYNTGINFTVNTGFSTVMNPVNSGNNVAPPTATSFTGGLITGALNDGSFYSYLNLTWVAAPTAAQYALSGDGGVPGQFTRLGVTTSTGLQYVSPVTGVVNFKLCSLGNGGAGSPPASTSFFFPQVEALDPAQIRFWVLPPSFGELDQMAIFYNRPSQSTTDTRIFYATGLSLPFKEVLDTTFYPALGVSLSGFSASGTTAWFQSDSFDTASTLLTQSAIQQANNTLLFLVDDELMSVGPVTGLSNDEWAFSVLRGALGTNAVSHSPRTSGWAFYLADLSSFTDTSFGEVFNQSGWSAFGPAPSGITPPLVFHPSGYFTGVATRYFEIQNNTATLQGGALGTSYTLPNLFPPPPSGLSGVVGAAAPLGSSVPITLFWDPPANTHVVSYNIYTDPTNDFFQVFSYLDNTTTTSYTDHLIAGLPYGNNYFVTTIDVNGNESIPSNVAGGIADMLIINSNQYITVSSDATSFSLNITGGFQHVLTLMGGSPTEIDYVDISAANLSSTPKGVVAQVSSDETFNCHYAYADTGNSPTQVALKFFKYDGTNLPFGPCFVSLVVAPS